MLVMLACALPLVVLLSSQLRIHCLEEGGACAPEEQVGAWLLLPLIAAWIVVVLALAIRAARWLRNRTRHPTSSGPPA